MDNHVIGYEYKRGYLQATNRCIVVIADVNQWGKRGRIRYQDVPLR